MKDNILNFIEDLKDKFSEGIWWIQDNLKLFSIIVGVSLSFILITAGVLNSTREDNDKIDYNSQEHLDYLQTKSEMVNKMFLNLEEDSDYMIFGADPSSLINIDNTVSLTYNFYVRKPFTDKEVIENTLLDFLEMTKLQTKSKGYDLRFLKVNLFFRKEVFDENLPPSGEFKYMLDYNKLDIEKLQVESKYSNSSVEGIAEGETALTNKVKPKDYRVYFDYEPLITDKSVKGLTDEEFAFYLKLDKYSALAGSFEAGVKLYLNWELGANVEEKSYTNIITQFRSFQERVEAVGEPELYFSEGTNLVVLQDNLLITNPQLLLFTKSDRVVTDPTEARKQLLEDFSDEFEFTLVSFAETQGTMYTEYSKVYEPASNNFINNMTNTQKIANGFVDSKGLPLDNIDYDMLFKGEIDDQGNPINKD